MWRFERPATLHNKHGGLVFGVNAVPAQDDRFALFALGDREIEGYRWQVEVLDTV